MWIPNNLIENLKKRIHDRFYNQSEDHYYKLKSAFDEAIQTNEKGIFLDLFTPILPIYQNISGATPNSSENSTEAANFLEWFKAIAFRDIDENTDLQFLGKIVKVGAILVGKDETWESQGLTAYIKWADYYSSNGFKYVCILGKGDKGFERSTEVKNFLLTRKGCTLINAKHTVECVSAEGTDYFISCFTFRFDEVINAEVAWEKVKKIYDCQVEYIKNNKDGHQVGMIVSNKDLSVLIFIPKSFASKNRFADLSKIYTPHDFVKVCIQGFNPSYSSLIGSVENLSDPWESDTLKKIVKGCAIEVEVRLITNHAVICEFEEGIECVIPETELALDPAEYDTSTFTINQKVKVKVLTIDNKEKRLTISPRLHTRTPKQKFYEKYSGKIIKAPVAGVIAKKGIRITLKNESFTGFIPWYEIAWGPIGKLENIFRKGDVVRPLVADYNPFQDQILISLKRKYIHQFNEWINIYQEKDVVHGKIVNHYENSVQVELKYMDLTVQAFILLMNVSCFCQVIQKDLEYYMPVGESFHFIVSTIDRNSLTIELSRKEYLQSFEEPEFGDTFTVSYAKGAFRKLFFYSDDIEGWINEPVKTINLGETITVMPLSLSSGEFAIV